MTSKDLWIRECSNGCGNTTSSEFGVCGSAACRKAYKQAYNQANRERNNARNRAYYEANRPHIRTKQNQKRRGENSQWVQMPCGNFETCGQYLNADNMVGFCKKTPACNRAYERRYYELRGDLVREINQRSVDRNPEKARETWNRATKNKKQKEGRVCRYTECSNILKPGESSECSACTWARVKAKRDEPQRKQALIERDGWQCSWCDQSLQDDFGAAVIDHIIPVTRGGPRDPQWNQQVLHPRCNRVKMNRITDQVLTVAAEHGYELARVDGKQMFRR